MPSSSKGSAEDEWVVLDRECLEVVKVVLTVLKPSGPIGDPFVTLIIKLGKTVSLFKNTLAVAVNIFLPISYIGAINLEYFLLAI